MADRPKTSSTRPGIPEAALEVARIGAFVSDAETGETIWQGRWRETLGLGKADPEPNIVDIVSLTPKEDRETALRALEAVQQRLRLDTTFRIRRSNRELRWIRLRCAPDTTTGGAHHTAGIIEDVTHRTEERLRLQQRDDEYRVLTGYALDMILRTDVERRVLYISKSAESVLGFTPEQLIGSEARTGIHRDDAPVADASYDEIVSGPGHSTALFRVRHADGHWVWIESLGHAVRGDDGKVREVLYIMRDTSRRVEAESRERRARDELLRARRDEDEIRRSEAMFRSLADSTPVLMWTVEKDGRPSWANRALFEFIGHVEGTRPRGPSRIHPDDVDRILADFIVALKHRTAFTAEARIERHDGEYRHTLFTALPRLDANGEFDGYIASGVDVTDIRKAEAANAEHRNRLAHSLRVESLDQMALGLAHELHQPLAAISAATGAALRNIAAADPNWERLREMMEEAQGQAIRAGALLQEMRDFIRKGSAEGEASESATMDLDGLVRSVASLARHEASRRDIQLELALATEPLFVRASRVQLQQVLINVVQNGLEAISAGNNDERVLRIESSITERGEIEVRVLDSGPGISSEGARHMFDVFYTTRDDGLGMGLAISRSIVEAHGGTLVGDSRPSGGACFSILLPAAATEAAEQADPDDAERRSS